MPKPTFKPIIIASNRRKDGTYPVVIRLTFKGVSRRLPTNLVCRSSDITTKSKQIKNADIISLAGNLIDRMREPLKIYNTFDLEDKDVDWIVAKIRAALATDNFRLDFFKWGEQIASEKNKGTATSYLSALNSLERYLGRRELDINDITKAMLLQWMEFVNNENKICYNARTKTWKYSKVARYGNGASSRYLFKLAYIYDRAKDKFNDEDAGIIVIPRSPFKGIQKDIPVSDGQKPLSVDMMQMIIDAKTDDRNIRIALDAFILSFLLMGVNMADLYAARDFKGKWWVYNRKKTMNNRPDKALMKVLLQDETRPYIARLKGKGAMWLNVLQGYSGAPDLCDTKVNRYLERWCEQVGVERFTFYAARKTFGTLARRVGVDKATIDECLGHIGDYKIADIYIERDWDLLAASNRKVIDLFSWDNSAISATSAISAE